MTENNWKQECEDFVNKQIAMEYWASLQYHAISSLEEREHADKLVDYQNKRGGNVVIYQVTNINNKFYNPESDKSNILQAFELALEMEQKVYESLLKLHKLGETHNDPALTDFIEGEYLTEQIDAINELSVFISQLKIIGNSDTGLWLFNKEFES